MSAIRPLSAIEVAAGAAVRFRDQYRHWAPEDKFADGKTKADVDEAFNTMAHTPENVAAALNKGWAYPECSCCGGSFDTVAEFRDEWRDDSTYRLCLACLKQASLVLGCVDVGA